MSNEFPPTEPTGEEPDKNAAKQSPGEADSQQGEARQDEPAMRAVPIHGEGEEDTNAPPPDDEEAEEYEPDDPSAERVFEADPSLALPGVREIERPGYRDPEWVNTEERAAERFEPIPSLVELEGSTQADNDEQQAAEQEFAPASTTATTPPAAVEAGASTAEVGEPTEEEIVAPQSPEQVAQVLEALLFVSSQPLSAQRLRELMDLDSVVPIRQAAARLREEYERRGRAFELVERAGGYLVQTRPAFSPFVLKLQRERQAQRISPAALTTLSIIAYRQPLTRAEVDAIRGVGSSHHIRALMERGLIKVVGRKSVPGNPSLYGTTNQFLLQFGLRSLRDLPQEADIEEVDEQQLRTQPNEETGQAEGHAAASAESDPEQESQRVAADEGPSMPEQPGLDVATSAADDGPEDDPDEDDLDEDDLDEDDLDEDDLDEDDLDEDDLDEDDPEDAPRAEGAQG